MSKLNSKIKKKINYTYTTTDGKIFNTSGNANEWQDILDTFETISKFDKNLDPTKNVEDTFYVCINTDKEALAFNRVSVDKGYDTEGDFIKEPGCYKYNDGWENIDEEIYNLQELIKIIRGI